MTGPTRCGHCGCNVARACCCAKDCRHHEYSTISISGTSFTAACETTEVPIEENWPEPMRQRSGRGWSFKYRVTAKQRAQIVSHLEDVYEALGGCSDADAVRERSALWRDIERIKSTS